MIYKPLSVKCFCDYIVEEVRRRRENLQKKNDELLKCMEPNFELLDNRRIFSPDVREDIKAEKTRRRRVTKMLFHLRYVDEDGYNIFLEALNDSRQPHIINFMNGT